jgi:hypothetical protein
MMKWFFKWMYNGLKNVETDDSRIREELPAISIGAVRPKGPRGITKAAMHDGSVNLNASPMNFRVYPATGGHIVEYTYYNDKTDMNQQALHLVPSDQDLGDSLSKIMTLEALKR